MSGTDQGGVFENVRVTEDPSVSSEPLYPRVVRAEWELLADERDRFRAALERIRDGQFEGQMELLDEIVDDALGKK